MTVASFYPTVIFFGVNCTSITSLCVTTYFSTTTKPTGTSKAWCHALLKILPWHTWLCSTGHAFHPWPRCSQYKHRKSPKVRRAHATRVRPQRLWLWEPCLHQALWPRLRSHEGDLDLLRSLCVVHQSYVISLVASIISEPIQCISFKFSCCFPLARNFFEFFFFFFFIFEIFFCFIIYEYFSFSLTWELWEQTCQNAIPPSNHPTHTTPFY